MLVAFRCAGQTSGCEAVAHAMHEIFDEEETDAVLLVDASYAFCDVARSAEVAILIMRSAHNLFS